MEKEKEFKIRSYGWTELAVCYNPTLQPDSVTRLLRCWVNDNKCLIEYLRATGYRDKQRRMTPW